MSATAISQEGSRSANEAIAEAEEGLVKRLTTYRTHAAARAVAGIPHA